MVRTTSHNKKRAEALKKARARRHGQQMKNTNIRREPSPVQVTRLEISPTKDRRRTKTVIQDINSSNDESDQSDSSAAGDDYQEHQSNFLMSLQSLRAMIRHMVCKRCKGSNGDMWQ